MFYAKLAFTNIRKNGKFYYPYLITCIFTVAMYYIMCFIAFNSGLNKMSGADNLKKMMGFGSYIVAIFSFIFLIYANGFLVKRRKREFGLYNILGLEKRHIGKIMFFESFYVMLGSLIAGILAGIMFSKLILMIMGRILKFDIKIGFNISETGIIKSIILFAVIFSIILLANLNSVRKTNPIELLNTSAAGEREPKTKWLITLVGVITLFFGYGIAITIKSPLAALMMFFVAVVLVVIGTYCLFISGSITFLKILRKNKNYYYKTNHFTSISGMIYRMKKNAAGLASICILSTMVLVVVSTTVSLYAGEEETLNYRYPYDISIKKMYSKPDMDTRHAENEKFLKKFLKDISDNNQKVKEILAYEEWSTYAEGKNNTFEYMHSSSSSLADYYWFDMIHAGDYEMMTGKKYDLSENEVVVCSKYFKTGDKIKLGNMEFDVVDTVKKFPLEDELGEAVLGDIMKTCYMVLADETVMDSVYLDALSGNEDEIASDIDFVINVNLEGTDEEKLDFYVNHIKNNEGYKSNMSTECRQSNRNHFYMTFGSFLFLGIFLGFLFLIITVLIIYYKQITEGYEDRQRFEIMKKVGMSDAEVRKSIKSQILTVFMLPVIVATCHVAGAFNMIIKLLAILNLINIHLFIICMVCTILAFIIIYAAVYLLTSRIYYGIIKS